MIKKQEEPMLFKTEGQGNVLLYSHFLITKGKRRVKIPVQTIVTEYSYSVIERSAVQAAFPLPKQVHMK